MACGIGQAGDAARGDRDPEAERDERDRDEPLVTRSPCGSTFSAKITPAIIAIQTRLMTPRLKRTIIRPQQQPTQ